MSDQLGPAADRYIPDDGFTARTLAALPAPHRSRRRWVLGVAVLLSVLIAAVLSADVVTLALRAWRATAATPVSGTWAVAALAAGVALVSALALLREET